MWNLKWATSLFLISLFTALTLFFSTTSAQDDGALKAKAETLLSILNEVNGSLVSTFNELKAEGIEVPFMARKNYLEGNLLTREALSLMEQGKFVRSSSSAVEALQMLKEALREAGEAMPEKPMDPSEEAAKKAINVKAAITRTYEYTMRLEKIHNRTSVQGYRSADLKRQVESAKRHLVSALAKLSTGDVDGAEKDLATAKALLSEAVAPLNSLTTVVKVSKTRQFLEDTEKRLIMLRANITAIPVHVSPQVREASLSALNSAESRLQKAKALMANNLIDETINELVKSRENIKKSVKYLESAGVFDKVDAEVKGDTDENEVEPCIAQNETRVHN